MNIDIDLEQEQQFYLFLKQNHLELSEFFKKVVLNSLTEDFKEIPSPYDSGKELFGRFSSGETQRSIQRKKLIREKIYEKYRR